MSFWALLGWSFATGIVVYVGFMLAAFSGGGAVPPEDREQLWKLWSGLFPIIYLIAAPLAVLLALILHFTRFSAQAHLALIAAAVVSIAYPFSLLAILSRPKRDG